MTDDKMNDKTLPTFSPGFTDEKLVEPLVCPDTKEEHLAILKQKFGFDGFYNGQYDAIISLVKEHESALIVLQTGGGKSLIYQYSSLFLPGLTIVVTPLISLMAD